MKKATVGWLSFVSIVFILNPRSASAGLLDKIKNATDQLNQYNANAQQQNQNPNSGSGQTYSGGGSLSAALGATHLDGLDKFAGCQNETYGYHEKLIGDRLEMKLANSPNLNGQDRAMWVAEIQALRAVSQTRKPYAAPNPKDPQHYFLGLTDPEQVAINSMTSRRMEETRLKCEHLYGSMSRYSNTGQSDLQDQYEAEMKANLDKQQAVDVNAIPVEPLPSSEELSPDYQMKKKREARHAKQEAMKQKLNDCAAGNKGLRIKLTAEALQRKLDSSPNLSPKDRADFQADVNAAFASAGKGLEQIEPVDPSNPQRALMRLSAQDQAEINAQFSQQYMQSLRSCSGVASRN